MALNTDKKALCVSFRHSCTMALNTDKKARCVSFNPKCVTPEQCTLATLDHGTLVTVRASVGVSITSKTMEMYPLKVDVGGHSILF